MLARPLGVGAPSYGESCIRPWLILILMETWIIFVVWLHINYTVNAVEIFSTIFAPNERC